MIDYSRTVKADCGHMATLDGLVRKEKKGIYLCTDCNVEKYTKENTMFPLRTNNKRISRLMSWLFMILVVLAIGLISSPVVSAITCDDAYAYFNMNDDADDSSGNGKDGSIEGSVTFATPGILGDGAFFDASGDYLKWEETLQDDVDEFAASFWVQLPTGDLTPGECFMIGNNLFSTSWEGWDFRLDDNERLDVIVGDSDEAAYSYDFNTGSELGEAWQNYIIYYDQNTDERYYVYLNGVLIHSQALSTFTTSSHGDFRISATPGTANSNCYDMVIDEVGIWNKTGFDNVTDVAEIYNGGVGYDPCSVNEAPYTAPTLITSPGTTEYSIDGDIPTIEYEFGNYAFLINYSDSDGTVTNITIIIYNGTGTELHRDSNVSLEGDSSIFNVHSGNFSDFQNTYNISVTVFDDSSDSSTNQSSFIFTDVTLPVALGIGDITINENDTVDFNVTFTDELFFGFNISCTNGYVNQTTGLNTQSYNFLASTKFATSSVCTWRYCDGHTGTLRRHWAFLQRQNEVLFRLDRRKQFSLKSNNNSLLSAVKLRDRVRFFAYFNESRAFTLRPRAFTFIYETPGKQYYIESNDYTAWLVDADNEVWFDLNGERVVRTEVFRINATAHEITLWSRHNFITFDSIGELNCVTTNQTITATAAVVPGSNEGFDNTGFATTADFLEVFFALLIWIMFFIMAFFIRNEYGEGMLVFNIAQTLSGVVAGYTLTSYNIILGILVLFVALTSAFFLEGKKQRWFN